MPALQKKHKKSSVHNLKSVMNTRYGGPEGIRTLDLSDANRTLSQLSYKPVPLYYTQIF